MVRVLFKDGKEIQVEKGTTFEELAEKVKGQGEYPIMLA